MSQDLFRPEVSAARRTAWLGDIQLAQPIRIQVLAASAVCVALGVLAFLAFGTYTWRSTVQGTLVPGKGLSVVTSPVSGVVSQIMVEEGGRVEQGQAVAIVSSSRATVNDGDTTIALQRRLEERQQGLDDAWSAEQRRLTAQRDGLLRQLQSAQRESADIAGEIQNRREQIQVAEETLGRLRRLEDEQYVSILQIKQEQSNALGWKGELQSFQRQATVNQRLIAQLQQSLDELPEHLQVVAAEHRNAVAALAQERVQVQSNGSLSVGAPVEGTVSVQQSKPGQSIAQGQPLLVVLPVDSPLEAELLVPSRSIGFVTPGDTVRLRFHAFPYQKFGHQMGAVTRVSRSAIPTTEGSATTNADAPVHYYRVTVQLQHQSVRAYGNDEPLLPGMQVDADIMGERRRLYEWLLEPLQSVRSAGAGS
ncbi:MULTISPECIES: HlyD family efflux transporter periplasmic adaptor subunit [unclassified Xanthomonas]|uniref:HlyD family secretion protein n=1 Tax=unclassified Xanthomonas TaxID=2643310 RepID=UPI0028830F0D|nr:MULTISPECIES: HlyD family efflux transporter periplasmic adaptor subunit [unclassified Xanthomonas]